MDITGKPLPLMEKASEFQGWSFQTHGSGCGIDLPAISSMCLGRDPGWAHDHSHLAIILQSSEDEAIRQRTLGLQHQIIERESRLWVSPVKLGYFLICLYPCTVMKMK